MDTYICMHVCTLISHINTIQTSFRQTHPALHCKMQTPQTILLPPQVTIVEKADSSSVLPSPLSISTKSKMTFLFANLKDRDFLVQRISDFLQKTPSKQPGGSTGGTKASTSDTAPEVR